MIGPVEASADVTLRGDQWTISRLSATIAGVRANGDLAYEPPAQPAVALPDNPDVAIAEEAVNGPAADVTEPHSPAITGELSFDRLPLSSALALAIGRPQRSKAGALWPDAKFAAASLSPPPVAVRVNVSTLDVADGVWAHGFSATLRLDRGRLDLDDMAMKIAAGAASGHATLRRDRDSATLSGTLNAERVPISGAGLSGRIGGTLDFASTGKSPDALIAGLAGGGTARLAGLELARSDPASLDQVLARSEGPEAQLDETNIAYAFDQELNKAPLKIPDGTAPLSLSGGTIKLGPLPIVRPRGNSTLSASFDLSTLSLETRLTLTSPSEDLKFWSGPPPGATVTVQDALSAPKRRLEVTALAAGLATQAIARETDRIANLEADIRERAFFNRRLKGERFMEQRRAELEDWLAEQARLKGIAERLEAERAETEKAEKAAAEKAALQRAEAEKAAEGKAAAERAEREAAKPFPQPELPPDLSREPPLAQKSLGAEFGSASPRAAVPTPPVRPKPRPSPERAPVANPTAGSLY